ncbi:sensor histidine kinase [Eudoraea chungangensis]|uniref:sensor histidine kinase n=1 Tax=Eudoraea chungangensis TaxID=1481905 RepID=UPI0023EB1731|nr:histidine kinase [Eudoraea chungangensis]
MTRSRRFYFQVLLWLGIWGALWLVDGANTRFVASNGLAFVFQTILLAGLIFYTAPALLFKKKYIYFTLISIAAIVLFAWISYRYTVGGPPPRPLGAEIRGMPQLPPPNRAPSKFFIHSLILALSYILGTFLETFWFAQKKDKETVKNKNEALKTELKLLKSQINPHFLFNSLNNIYALSVINSDKTQQSISYLSDMLRYVLYECEQERVPLSKEITYIENYIKLYALKSSRPFPISTDFDIQDGTIMVAPMLFIPFMENALKHSNIEKRQGTFIKIAIKATNAEVQLRIENSIPKETIYKDKVGGIGLENVKRRLQILYPQKHTLHIHNNGTFIVKLVIRVNGKD